MPAPIILGMVAFLEANVDGLVAFEGEIPRWYPGGGPVVLEVTPPIFRVTMTEAGLSRAGLNGEGWTFEDAYCDQGPLIFELWTTTRAATPAFLGTIEALLCNSANFPSIALPGGEVSNPYSVVDIQWGDWTNVMEEGLRDQNSNYIYRGKITCIVKIHGAIKTRP
jgi:hypothetical protein